VEEKEISCAAVADKERRKPAGAFPFRRRRSSTKGRGGQGRKGRKKKKRDGCVLTVVTMMTDPNLPSFRV